MITRDNYEEFFLLYVDNELSTADRMAVETFAAGHPDLGQELEALLQCKLEPGNDLFFGNPESLLKREEELLSYIDGEVDESGRQVMEDLVRKNPSLLKELELLRKTVSIPDPALIFRHKEALYRPQVSSQIFGLPPAWFRIAAAAVVLLAVGLLVLSRMERTGGPVIAKQTPATGADRNSLSAGNANKNNATTDNKIKGVVVTLVSPGALYSSEADHNGRADGDKGRTQHPGRKTKRSAPGEEAGDRGHPGRPADRMARVESVTNHTEAAEKDRSSSAEAARGGATEPTHGGTEEPVLKKDPGGKDLASVKITTADPQPVSKELSSFATQALLKDAASSNEDYDGFAMEQASPKKNKLRGIFRKVSRVFEKTARSDDTDNRHGVLIGNLQIALK